CTERAGPGAGRMSWWPWRKRIAPVAAAQGTDVVDPTVGLDQSDLDELEQISRAANSVIWAREVLDGMFRSLDRHQEMHQKTATECAEWCGPQHLIQYVELLESPAQVRLFTIMLKEFHRHYGEAEFS